ncbi:MAG: hypothetical protein AB7E85_06315 [Pseudobdellovibrionaceae bacterium]
MKKAKETGVSEKNYNDATVRALFRMLDKLDANSNVTKMSVTNKVTKAGLYQVELTASYTTDKSGVINTLDHLKSKLDSALHRAQTPADDYRDYPAQMAAHAYARNEIDPRRPRS